MNETPEMARLGEWIQENFAPAVAAFNDAPYDGRSVHGAMDENGVIRWVPILDRLERRKKETDAQYAARCHRWAMWERQEPRPDHWYTSDTEVAEYRAWAGTTALHERLVDDLMRITEES